MSKVWKFMELKLVGTSYLSGSQSKQFKTSIPNQITTNFDLLVKFENKKDILTYKIEKYQQILIITHEELSREERSKINEFIKEIDMVQRSENIKINPTRSGNSYTLTLEDKIIKYLNLKIENPLSYFSLTINNVEYLLISGKAKYIFKWINIESC